MLCACAFAAWAQLGERTEHRFAFHEAAAGLRAALLDDLGVALLVVDPSAEGGQGERIAREMLRTPGGPPCIVLSAGLDDAGRARWLRRGALACLGKPASVPAYTQLMRALASAWLDRIAVEAAAPAGGSDTRAANSRPR